MFWYYNDQTEHMFLIEMHFYYRKSNHSDMRKGYCGEGIMKRSLVYILLSTLLGCTFFSLFFINALAKETPGPKMISYYTYIQIQPGDTLWSIAETYTEGTDLTIDEYVHRLKQMNHIGEDTIHTGHYLTVMYQRPETIMADEPQSRVSH